MARIRMALARLCGLARMSQRVAKRAGARAREDKARAANLAQEYPETNRVPEGGWGAFVIPFREALVRGGQPEWMR